MRRVFRLKSFVVSLLLMASTFAALAQYQPAVPYFCGFEDPVENANWTFIAGSAFSNHWCTGTAVYNYGTSAMYISPNNGATATYSNSKGSAVAYRTIKLQGGQMYQIDFDWMARGSSSDKLYVCYVTNPGENMNAWATNNNAVPSGVSMYAKPWQTKTVNGRQLRDTVMQGRSTWMHGSFEVNGTNNDCYLAFFWTNGQGTPLNPGACIDNVQINKKNPCPKPTNLTFTNISGSSGVLSWTSAGTSWDVTYCNNNSQNQWFQDTGLTQPRDTINGLVKGMYTFWVRAHCGNDSSSWAVVSNILVYQSLAECLDYIALDAPYVDATYGGFSNPYGTHGLVDNGSSAQTSRHTVHYGQGEYDPRTGNLLQTVPPGEVASVRLGNWQNGAEAESLTYTYTVDSAAAIMIMKYAVVLQDPDHSPSEQPRFKMEILNNNGQLIDAACGSADFIPGQNTQSWGTFGTGYDLKRWKDWTTLGLNLKPYAGQTIKIRFTTYDCSQSGHFGYAYFTLDCAYAQITGESCGSISVDSIEAPDGFAYTWYNENDMTTPISTSQSYQPQPGDTSNYICRVSFVENPNCYFDLRATTKPRWPKAQGTYAWNPAGCSNNMDFTNTSYIHTSDQPAGTTPAALNTVEWDFGNGETANTPNATAHYPLGGGTFRVRLIANMVGGACADTIFYDVTVPQISPDSTVHRKTMCQGQTWKIDGHTFTETTYLRDTLANKIGCDSLVIYDCKVLDVFETVVDTTICEGQSVQVFGQPYSTSGSYTVNGTSSIGCDSIVTLNLVVNPILGISLTQIGEICADDGSYIIHYNSNGTTPPTDFAIDFSAAAKAAGFVDTAAVITDGQLDIIVKMPASVKAGRYDATLHLNDTVYRCGDAAIPFSFEVQYRSSIIEQKWNDCLAVLNQGYNGDLKADGTRPNRGDATVNGYNFVAFQWYKDNMPIEGETKSYIYITPTLDYNATYRALLTRDDGVSVMTCGIQPQTRTDINVVPTVTMPKNVVRVMTSQTSGVVTVYNTTGAVVSRTTINDMATDIVAPAEQGLYIMTVELADGTRESFKIIVKNQ